MTKHSSSKSETLMSRRVRWNLVNKWKEIRILSLFFRGGGRAMRGASHVESTRVSGNHEARRDAQSERRLRDTRVVPEVTFAFFIRGFLVQIAVDLFLRILWWNTAFSNSLRNTEFVGNCKGI